MSKPRKKHRAETKEVKLRFELYIKLDKYELYRHQANEEFGDWSSAYELKDVQCYKNAENIYYDECIYSPTDWEAGSIVFIVIEGISDGDTFGCCEADFRVRNAFRTKEEAVSWITSNSVNLGYFERHNSWIVAERNVLEKCYTYESKFGMSENIKFI